MAAPHTHTRVVPQLIEEAVLIVQAQHGGQILQMPGQGAASHDHGAQGLMAFAKNIGSMAEAGFQAQDIVAHRRTALGAVPYSAMRALPKKSWPKGVTRMRWLSMSLPVLFSRWVTCAVII